MNFVPRWMSIRANAQIVLALFTTIVFTNLCHPTMAHPGHSHGSGAKSSPGLRASREWRIANNSRPVSGTFVIAREDVVQIRLKDDSLMTVRLDALSPGDQRFVRDRVVKIADDAAAPTLLALVEPNQVDARGSTSKDTQAPMIATHFDPFVRLRAIQTRWDNRYFYVESNGIPGHQMMVGITAWQQQVPLPQKYTGENAWQIPLHPVPARIPATTKDRFLRGAIAIAMNGIPIFNPLNNRGDDAYLFGELDEFGGHCGRADDYHYHLAPTHLEEALGKGKPIAYALDGYPIYGYEEPDGTPVKHLDSLNGHTDADGNYHYHATRQYPYLNGGFYGVVTEKDGQVDPQPRAEPVRPALPPLRDARIIDFKQTKPGSYKLTYTMREATGTVSYTINGDGSADFVFVDSRGKVTAETYFPRRREADDRDRRSPPPMGARPRPKDRQPPGDDRRRPPRDADKTVERQDDERPTPASQLLAVTSRSIDEHGFLSIDCTCDGTRESPAVAWKDVPAGTKSFAVSLWHTAPDQEKSYWVVYNIPVSTTAIAQNSTEVATLGVNDRRRAEYEPVCSKGPGVKTYHLTVYALSSRLDLAPEKASRKELLEAIKGITLATGTVDLKYERKGSR